MDVLDRIAEPLYVVGLFGMLAIIVGTVARCMRAFIQGINEGDDPRHAKPPHEAAGRSRKYDREMAVRSLKIKLYWMLAYLSTAVILFVVLTSGGWPRMSYTPDLLMSLVVPLLVLQSFAYFLRLARWLKNRPTDPPRHSAESRRWLRVRLF